MVQQQYSTGKLRRFHLGVSGSVRHQQPAALQFVTQAWWRRGSDLVGYMKRGDLSVVQKPHGLPVTLKRCPSSTHSWIMSCPTKRYEWANTEPWLTVKFILWPWQYNWLLPQIVHILCWCWWSQDNDETVWLFLNEGKAAWEVGKKKIVAAVPEPIFRL